MATEFVLGYGKVAIGSGIRDGRAYVSLANKPESDKSVGDAYSEEEAKAGLEKADCVIWVEGLESAEILQRALLRACCGFGILAGRSSKVDVSYGSVTIPAK